MFSRELFISFYGKNSDFNIVGKIILTPLALTMVFMAFIFDVFLKRK